jgi:hypothetical protein
MSKNLSPESLANDLIWGVRSIADEIGRSRQQTYYDLEGPDSGGQTRAPDRHRIAQSAAPAGRQHVGSYLNAEQAPREERGACLFFADLLEAGRIPDGNKERT